MNNSFKGIVKSTGSDVRTKTTGAQYVLMNVEITDGPAKGLVVLATRTTVTAEKVVKDIPAMDSVVTVYHTVVPSTKEGEKNQHFFEIVDFEKSNQYLLDRSNSLLDKDSVKDDKDSVNSTKDNHNRNFPNSNNETLTNPNFTKSILIGVITAILIGFIFPDCTYFYDNEELSFDAYNQSMYKEDYVIKEEFNYKLAFISSALVVAFMVFVYYDEKRKQNMLLIINSLLNKVQVKTIEDNHNQKNQGNSNDTLTSFKGFKN